MPNGGVGSGILGRPGPGGWNRWEINFPIRDFLFGKMMDYVTRAKMIKNSFIWKSQIAFLGYSQKGNLMGYVSRPKMIKKFFLWRSIIAFLGNSQKGNNDGLCNIVKNDENFFSPGKHNCLFRKLLIT